MFRRAKETWISWHRGLQNPEGKPDFSFSLLKRAFRDNNTVYWKGLREFYVSLLVRKKSPLQDKEKLLQKEVDKTGDELAKAVHATRTTGADVLRRWIADRTAMMSNVMRQFGAGFQEGKNSPDVKIDWRDWISKK